MHPPRDRTREARREAGPVAPGLPAAARRRPSGCRGLGALRAPLLLRGLPGRRQAPYSALGVYNEHLVRDVGALNLAPGVLLAAAAVLLGRSLVRASLAAWLVYAVPHLAFHVSVFGALSPLDDLANLATLGLAALFPLVLLALSSGRGEDEEPPAGSRP